MLVTEAMDSDISTRCLNDHVPRLFIVAVPSNCPVKSEPRYTLTVALGVPLPEIYQSGPLVAATVPVAFTVDLSIVRMPDPICIAVKFCAAGTFVPFKVTFLLAGEIITPILTGVIV